MGGATALRVGCSNPKVGCILTHDPWLFPLHKEIYTYKLKNLDQKCIYLLYTSSFHDFTPKSEMDHFHCFQFLKNRVIKCKVLEDVEFPDPGATHSHQTDKIILNNYEIEFPNMPRDKMILQMHSWLWLKFLWGNGYHSETYDIE